MGLRVVSHFISPQRQPAPRGQALTHVAAPRSFRRRRFNWPQDIPELKMEEEAEETQLSSPAKAYQGLAIGHGPGHHLFRSVSRASPPATRESRSGPPEAESTGGPTWTSPSELNLRRLNDFFVNFLLTPAPAPTPAAPSSPAASPFASSSPPSASRLP